MWFGALWYEQPLKCASEDTKREKKNKKQNLKKEEKKNPLKSIYIKCPKSTNDAPSYTTLKALGTYRGPS